MGASQTPPSLSLGSVTRSNDWNPLINHSTTPPPPACPSCGAVDPVFNANTAPEVTYMRCKKCGEVWNAGRCVQPRASVAPRFGGWR
jgi:predicted Zn finger-like uncharacterized protein